MKTRKAGTPAQRNGESGSPQGHGAGRQRSATRTAGDVSPDPGAKCAEQLASFSELAPPAVDAPAWPVHLMLWLEANLRITPPKTSGLRVERNHRIPVRTFFHAVEPLSGSAAHIEECHPAVPDLGLEVSRSGLRTVGWEPRNILAAAALGTSGALKTNTERRGKEGGQ